MRKLIITEPAKNDIQDAYDWWQNNRSTEQADRWFREIYQTIGTLRNNPERCGNAPEKDLLPQGIQQLLFGISRRMTHRVIFTIADDVVTVLRVRHTSQNNLTFDDLT